MSNSFTARGVAARVDLSNGATGVLFDVLAIAGSARATTPWQQRLTLHFCDSERIGSGISGFDLAELPWTHDWPAEQDFFLEIIDIAATRQGWDKLAYDPPHARDHLLAYREMLAAFTPVADPPPGDWAVPPAPDEVVRCTRHGIFQGEYGCRLCDASIQPVA